MFFVAGLLTHENTDIAVGVLDLIQVKVVILFYRIPAASPLEALEGSGTEFTPTLFNSF